MTTEQKADHLADAKHYLRLVIDAPPENSEAFAIAQLATLVAQAATLIDIAESLRELLVLYKHAHEIHP